MTKAKLPAVVHGGPERVEALGRAVARVLQGSSVRAAAAEERIPETTLRRHVARTGEYATERREVVALRALDAADKAARRMARDMDVTDDRNVASWARASASLAGLDGHTGDSSVGGAGDAVAKLAALLGQGGKVTASLEVEPTAVHDAQGGQGAVHGGQEGGAIDVRATPAGDDGSAG